MRPQAIDRTARTAIRQAAAGATLRVAQQRVNPEKQAGPRSNTDTIPGLAPPRNIERESRAVATTPSYDPAGAQEPGALRRGTSPK